MCSTWCRTSRPVWVWSSWESNWRHFMLSRWMRRWINFGKVESLTRRSLTNCVVPISALLIISRSLWRQGLSKNSCFLTDISFAEASIDVSVFCGISAKMSARYVSMRTGIFFILICQGTLIFRKGRLFGNKGALLQNKAGLLGKGFLPPPCRNIGFAAFSKLYVLSALAKEFWCIKGHF